MKNLFWVIIIALFLVWIVGYFVFEGIFGGAIHILVVIALVMIILRTKSDKEPPEQNDWD